MWVLIREASNARNLRALLAMVREHGPDYCAFCTDDREPDFLVREGHIDQMCRIAVAEGIAPEDVAGDGDAARRAAHGLLDRGAIAPGYAPTSCCSTTSRSFRASLVLKDGARAPTATPRPFAPGPGCVRDTMHCAARRSTFAIRRRRPRAGDRDRSPGS